MKFILCLLLLLLVLINVHTEACEGGQWSIWISRDLPSGNGDSETLKDILLENPSLNCANPTQMQVRTVGTHIAASATGQKFTQNQLPQGFTCENIKQSNGQCLDYEVRFCCPVCQGNAWTSWVSRDVPYGNGDSENLKDMLLEKKITCDFPTIVEARDIASKKTAYATGQVFEYYTAQKGFSCANAQQGANVMCLDYEVRFCCPQCDGVWSKWFDRDDPTGNGDCEALSEVLKENTAFTCEAPALVKARTVGTQLNAFSTGQKITINPQYGFNCLNSDQGTGSSCLDYEVAFCCNNCARGQWSQWFDRDNPSGNGDSEDYNNIVKENPTFKCPNPAYVAARTVGTHINSLQTGQKITMNIPFGFNCLNSDQSNLSCLDYEVKFCCPKWFWYQAGTVATAALNSYCVTQCGGTVKQSICFNGPLPASPSSSYVCYFGFQ